MALKLLASNNASSVLAAGISASATSLAVNTGTGTLFPSPVTGTSYFKLTLVDAATGTLTEIMHVTAVSGDNFTILRGQEGTTARIWSANDIAANMFTAGTLAEFLQTNNNFSEIAAAGATAMSAAVANLGLGTGLTGVIGEARNAKMSVTAASAIATFTADEVIVGVALGGLQYRLGSFNKTINLATVGAGGMDTGAAPASGYVALYAIYNPTTAASALLAVNATAAVVPEVYGGSNMPAGYTSSALVSVWGTNASGQFKPGTQTGRRVFFIPINVLNTTGSGSNNPFSAFNISAAAPRNAKDVNLTATIGTNTATGQVYSSVNVAADIGGSGAGTVTVSGSSGANLAASVTMIIPILTPQVLYQTPFASSGVTTYNVTVSFYTF